MSRCLEEVRRVTNKPVRSAILTQVRRGEKESGLALARKGIEIVVQRDGARALREALDRESSRDEAARKVVIREFSDRLVIGEGARNLQVLAQGSIGGPGDSVVHLAEAGVLFAGPLCVYGPRAELEGVDTFAWLAALNKLMALKCGTIVPGAGSPGGQEVLSHEVLLLRDLRSQVSHLVAQGRPIDVVCKEVRVSPKLLAWAPYDHPSREDIEHVYGELTVPRAPFNNGRRDSSIGAKPKALALVADQPHEPERIETNLVNALERIGLVPYVAFDVRALTAENLKRVQVLVILRDGAIWPGGAEKPGVTWMTPDQERAVVEFVEAGGGLLALHNATGLYPEGGPYLKLLGGTYQGHGPLERFSVKVVDRSHPITRGVSDFEVADEQHTPAPDRRRVHMLLESRSDEGTIGAAGWALGAGRGRVCYLANGHTNEALSHPEYQKLLGNAALWCVGRDDVKIPSKRRHGRLKPGPAGRLRFGACRSQTLFLDPPERFSRSKPIRSLSMVAEISLRGRWLSIFVEKGF